MPLAVRIARHERQRRVRKKVLEQRRLVIAEPAQPGPTLDFVAEVSPRLRRPEHLAELADAIDRGAQGEEVRECFSYPVRHGKTTLVQHGIAKLLRQDPTRGILYVSYAHGFATKQTMKAREISERAGVVMGSVRRRDEWTTRAGGFVKAAGIGGQLTGEGFTDIFLDDPHKNRAEAESRIIREGVIDAFFNDVFTRRDPRGTNFYITQARWNVNDLVGVLTRMEEHPFKKHNRPALDENGNPLAPWLFDRRQLEELRATLGPYVWASLYQGEPRPRGGALFIDPTLVDIGAPPGSSRTAIGLDLATSTRTRADHNAAVVIRKNLANGIMDVLEARRARGTIVDRMRDREIVDEGFLRIVVRMLHEYPDADLWMYAQHVEIPLVGLIERVLGEMLGYSVTINIMPIEAEKYLRAQAYAASWNTGKVRIPGRARVVDPHLERDDQDEGRNRDGWQHQFVGEHVEFTGIRGLEDDMVDAATAAHDGLNQPTRFGLVEAMAGVKR